MTTVAPSLLLFQVLTGCVPVLTSPQDTDTGPDWVAPDNDWPSTPPPEGTVGEGFAEGQIPPDFRLLDQTGDIVSLWQFYGLVVVVDLSTMWCAPCRALAADVEATWNDYRDQGFVYVTVLSQDVDGQVPDVPDLQDWASYYGITAPILADDGSYTGRVVTNNTFPRLLLLDLDLRIVENDIQPTDDATVRAAVDGLLGR